MLCVVYSTWSLNLKLFPRLRLFANFLLFALLVGFVVLHFLFVYFVQSSLFSTEPTARKKNMEL